MYVCMYGCIYVRTYVIFCLQIKLLFKLKGPVQDRAFAGVHVIKEKHLTIRYGEHEAISFRSAEQNKRISIIVMLIVVVDSI